MPINAGLINALMPRVRSVQDYQDDYTRRDIAEQGMQRNALLMQQAQQDQQEQQRAAAQAQQAHNALMQEVRGMPPPQDNQRLQALHRLTLAGGGKPMDYLNEAYPAQPKPSRQVVGGSLVEVAGDGAVKELYKAPEKKQLPPEIVRVIDHIRSLPKDDPARPQLEAYVQKQLTHAPGTNVNVGVNTEKTYAGNIAEGLAKNDVAALDAARSAPDRVNTARSIKQVLDSNKAMTGTAAETRLAITKALSTAGIIDGTSTTATEDLVSMLNTQTLDAIKTAGMGSGQGFTDKDRQFLQDAKSGRIEINAASLRRMADLNEKAGVAAIEYGNKIAGRLKNNPTLGTVGQDLEVKVPAGALDKAIAAEAARRKAAKGP